MPEPTQPAQAPFLLNPKTGVVFIPCAELRKRPDLTPVWSPDGLAVQPPSEPAPAPAPAPAPNDAKQVQRQRAPKAPREQKQKPDADQESPVPQAQGEQPQGAVQDIPVPPTPDQFAADVAAALAAAQ